MAGLRLSRCVPVSLRSLREKYKPAILLGLLGITYSTGTFADGAAYISPAASLWLRFSLR